MNGSSQPTISMSYPFSFCLDWTFLSLTISCQLYSLVFPIPLCRYSVNTLWWWTTQNHLFFQTTRVPRLPTTRMPLRMPKTQIAMGSMDTPTLPCSLCAWCWAASSLPTSSVISRTASSSQALYVVSYVKSLQWSLQWKKTMFDVQIFHRFLLNLHSF